MDKNKINYIIFLLTEKALEKSGDEMFQLKDHEYDSILVDNGIDIHNDPMCDQAIIDEMVEAGYFSRLDNYWYVLSDDIEGYYKNVFPVGTIVDYHSMMGGGKSKHDLDECEITRTPYVDDADQIVCFIDKKTGCVSVGSLTLSKEA